MVEKIVVSCLTVGAMHSGGKADKGNSAWLETKKAQKAEEAKSNAKESGHRILTVF